MGRSELGVLSESRPKHLFGSRPLASQSEVVGLAVELNGSKGRSRGTLERLSSGLGTGVSQSANGPPAKPLRRSR